MKSWRTPDKEARSYRRIAAGIFAIFLSLLIPLLIMRIRADIALGTRGQFALAKVIDVPKELHEGRTQYVVYEYTIDYDGYESKIRLEHFVPKGATVGIIYLPDAPKTHHIADSKESADQIIRDDFGSISLIVFQFAILTGCGILGIFVVIRELGKPVAQKEPRKLTTRKPGLQS